MKYNSVNPLDKENVSNEEREFRYMWGKYRYLSVKEIESIPTKEIMKGIGKNHNYTYNCSLRKLLSEKFSKIGKTGDVVKLETNGFAIREIDYKEERDEFMKNYKTKKEIK